MRASFRFLLGTAFAVANMLSGYILCIFIHTRYEHSRVTTLDALRRLSFPGSGEPLIVDVLGAKSATDGGGGSFIYSSHDTARDDGGTIIAPISGRGRWVREFAGPVAPEWWGVNGVSDDVAINKALKVAEHTHTSVQLRSKTYHTSATIEVYDTILSGIETGTVIEPASGVSVALSMNATTDRDAPNGEIFKPCCIERLKVLGNHTSRAIAITIGRDLPHNRPTIGYRVRDVRVMNFSGTGARGISVEDAVGSSIENVDISGCETGIYFNRNNPTNIWPTTTYIANLYCHWNRGRGCDIEDGFGLNFVNCYFEANGAEGVFLTCQPGNTAMLINFQSCQFEGNWHGSPSPNCFGVNIVGGPGFVNAKFSSCLFASYRGGEIAVHDAFVAIDNPQCSQYTKGSFVIFGKSDVYFDQLTRNFDWPQIIADRSAGSARVTYVATGQL